MYEKRKGRKKRQLEEIKRECKKKRVNYGLERGWREVKKTNAKGMERGKDARGEKTTKDKSVQGRQTTTAFWLMAEMRERKYKRNMRIKKGNKKVEGIQGGKSERSRTSETEVYY